MKNIAFLFSSLIIIFLYACDNDETLIETQVETPKVNKTIETPIEKPSIDDANAEETAADTSSSGVYQKEVNENASLQDALINKAKETAIEEGMSFCECVKKNKRLTETMMADETSDEDFDKAAEELKEMKTGACKIMFPKQSNVEEQEAHKRKVNRCLGK